MSDVGFPANTGYAGPKRPKDGLARFNVISFVVNQILAGISTAMVVQVKSVQAGSGLLPGLVNIQPLVNQLDGNGNAMPHGTIFNIPYIRLQGGPNAIICDPVVNDIGLAIFAQRDISLVKKNKTVSNPGSRRRFDMADGIYVGGWGNTAPVQYVQFTGSGINIVDKNGNSIIMAAGKITITTPVVEVTGAIQVDNTGNVAVPCTVSGSMTVTGDITAGSGSGDQIGIRTHTHSGTQPGTGTTGGPVPGS